ncbi:cytochrome P450 [Nocardia sp. NBC_01377]|uniref:cytochrome P450 n=1 Tax=Nocardia sp. NBC_01377 TaxID=2903595 RepID=UPI00325156D8
MTTSRSRDYVLSDIDHHADYFVEHNYEIYEELRAECPIAHSTAHDGFYIFLDYDTVYSADHDVETFSSAPGRNVPAGDTPPQFVPLDSDPPLHTQYRRIGVPYFSPKLAKQDEPYFRSVATELIDEFIESGEADIVGQLTTPLPAIWILKMLGFDETRWADWVGWVHTMIHDRHSEHALAARDNVVKTVFEEINLRRTEGFRDDLLSVIMQGRVDGEPLPDHLIFTYAHLMLIGGMDTTSGLTGNALVQLIRQPELRERLIREPSILPQATEEFLRHDTPAQTQGRTVTKDCVYKGQEFKAGDKVLLSHAAANRDPKVFPDPDKIDFDRKPNRHIAFGVGPHRCLGSHHAKVMFEVMISEILSRLPDFTLAGDIEYFPDGGDVWAVRRLPIRFTPGPRSR